MADLSPDALAIFKAAWECPIILGDNQGTRMRQVAAALRAAADQLAYGHGSFINGFWAGTSAIIDEDKLLAIADELETK